nr:tRNA(His) guanylyltransferase 1-like isoform X1 [Ipomoea batatas]
MANNKYEYVKSFEVEDEVMVPNIVVVRIDGRDFRRFSEAHEFDKPYDAKALHLMNACSTTVLEEFPDIAFAYGFSDEFRYNVPCFTFLHCTGIITQYGAIVLLLQFCVQERNQILPETSQQNILPYCVFFHICICHQMEGLFSSTGIKYSSFISITCHLLCINGSSSSISHLETK